MRRRARRLARLLLALGAALSLLLCVAACVLWVRSRSGSDVAMWAYYRWLPDGGAAGDWVDAVSGPAGLWCSKGSARAGPPRAELAVGIHINAHDSGGRPRVYFDHQRHNAFDRRMLRAGAATGTSGWGPLRWQRSTRFDAGIPLTLRSTRVGVAHWLAAVLLTIPSTWAASRRVRRWRRGRFRHRRGLCRACGYDLRASPDRCPECGEPGHARGV